MRRALVWFRTDLRVRDNPALMAACSRGNEVVALYCVTPAQWRQHGMAAIQQDFIRRNLACLEAELAGLNIPLMVVDTGSFSQLPQALVDLCGQWQIGALFANREYLLNELARDQQVAARLSQAGINCHWFDDSCLIPPGDIVNGSGQPYKVFSAFRKPWLARLRECLPLPEGMPGSTAPMAVLTQPSKPAIWPHGVDSECWPAGERAALARLEQFCDDDLARYAQRRDLPAEAGTSCLSPYLALGVLSPRQCLAQALLFCPEVLEQGAGFSWLNELGWRDFYRHIAFAYPRVCRGQAFQAGTDAIVWNDDAGAFAAWCEGRTGYPIVDAAMRQLHQSGWMHNRLRMIVASFLVKDLHIDWRRGEAYFMACLIDGDFAANNGGWQWAASTGTDAAPYFRIFNPVSQSKRFDPEGRFLRRYLPELAHLDNRAIHWPHGRHDAWLRRQGYPAPMVDHQQARQQTLAMFQQIR